MKRILCFGLVVVMSLFAISFAHAQAGSALVFDGIDDYVNVNTTFPGLTELTIEAWIYPTAGGVRWIASNGRDITDAPADGGFNFFYIGANLHGMIFRDDNNAIVEASGGTLVLNQWQHVAMTYDTDAVRLYINGSLVATQGGGGGVGIDDGALLFHIGYLPYGGGLYPFSGQMDEVRIWNVARTEGQIQSFMNTAVAGPVENALAVWNFDNVSGAVAPDVTTNGYNGTIFGATTTNSAAGLSSSMTIPTVGEWAMVILTLSMLIGATIIIRRREAVLVG